MSGALDALRRRYDGHTPGLMGARHSYAVLCPLVEKPDGLYLLFEVRAAGLRQGGEVCFPGGRVDAGESAVDCALRETEEELGLRLKELRIQKTWWHGKRDQLMIGFVGRAEDTGFRLSSEVATARWVPVREALGQVHPKGSISYALIEQYLNT